MKGLVAFSFALGEQETNPCNVRLARATLRIWAREDERVIVVSQWEIAKEIQSCGPGYGIPIDHVVEKHREGRYLDSGEVMVQAAEVFRAYGVTEVIPVAQRGLHMMKCRKLVKAAGFTPVKRKIGRVGFYPEPLQWWTRGPIRLCIYAVLQQLTGRRGK